MTHDQKMMVFAIKCNIEDGRADVAGKLAKSLVSQMKPKDTNDFELVSSETAYGRTVSYPFAIRVY